MFSQSSQFSRALCWVTFPAMPFYECMWPLRAPLPYAQVMFGSSLSLVERFATSLLAVKQSVSLRRRKKKNLTKRKLKCHVESGIGFDVEPCSGIWGDHWRRRWFGEFYLIKLNRSMNEWLYLMAPLMKCSYCLSSTSSSPIKLTILTCSRTPYKGWCMLFGTVKVEFLQKDGALLLKIIYNRQIQWIWEAHKTDVIQRTYSIHMLTYCYCWYLKVWTQKQINLTTQ